MPRVRDMSEVVATQKRWARLLKFVARLRLELGKQTNTRKRAAVVICGRMLNNIACTFAVSEDTANKILHDLNAMLMRIDDARDEQNAYVLEQELLGALVREMEQKISGLEKEIVSSRSFT